MAFCCLILKKIYLQNSSTLYDQNIPSESNGPVIINSLYKIGHGKLIQSPIVGFKKNVLKLTFRARNESFDPKAWRLFKISSIAAHVQGKEVVEEGHIQCDQFGLFLKNLDYKFSYKSNLNVSLFCWAILKSGWSFWGTNCSGNVRDKFWSNWATFNSNIWAHWLYNPLLWVQF